MWDPYGKVYIARKPKRPTVCTAGEEEWGQLPLDGATLGLTHCDSFSALC